MSFVCRLEILYLVNDILAREVTGNLRFLACASVPLLLLLFTLTPPYLSSPSSFSSSFAKGCSTRTRDIRLLLALKNVTLFPPLSLHPFLSSSLPPSLRRTLPPP